MKCPVCGKGCIQPAKEVMAEIEQRYPACPACAPEPNLDKTAVAKHLPKRVERCQSCGKATLDGVMLDALRLLQEFGLRDEDDTLRSVGSPLIEVGYPLAYSPRLGPMSLIISGDRYSKEAAEAMVKQIPEIKGVILSRGIAGVVDSGTKPRENVLLAGCDLRADISQSLFGEAVIYKSQSRIHIEFSRQSAPKMRILEQLYFQGKLRDVVDGLCGPGTLGLMCVLAGAKRVVFNDAWLAGVQNVLLNLDANRSLLGIDDIEYPESSKNEVGREPVLVGRAHGSCEIEVYHGDLRRLFSRAKPADICLIDHFPGAKTAEMERACRCCKEIVIV
ncbi:MAG: hypothetical protein QG575_757 [Euryarchaeota archaeon]|nr:hypothetical protein [Euryarchaeota archaeon]